MAVWCPQARPAANARSTGPPKTSSWMLSGSRNVIIAASDADSYTSEWSTPSSSNRRLSSCTSLQPADSERDMIHAGAALTERVG